ncbi:MAG: nucleoside recognition domain-containing protein [Bacillota bacterium]|nr:nucleoside recognition domain-containing protein [Bacillota bacterium]
MYDLIMKISAWIVPLFLLIVFIYASYKRIKVFDTFVEGGKEGFALAIRLIPYMVGIFVAIGIFRASGALDLVIKFLMPILLLIGVPAEILPVLIVRPLSGPASLGLTIEMINQYGPDSFIGRLAATIDGTTDTTLYILAIYFASVGVRKARYSLPVGLMADIVGFITAIYITTIVFK